MSSNSDKGKQSSQCLQWCDRASIYTFIVNKLLIAAPSNTKTIATSFMDNKHKELLKEYKLPTLDVDWLIRTNTNNANPKESADDKGYGICNHDELQNEANTPSPKDSLSGTNESDRKNPAAQTHTTVIGPNRIVKQRRSSLSFQAQGPDTHEYGKHEYANHNPFNSDISLRRTKSLSMNSSGHIEETASSKTPKRKPGFFKSLFGLGKKSKDNQPRHEDTISSSVRRNSNANLTPSIPTSSVSPQQASAESSREAFPTTATSTTQRQNYARKRSSTISQAETYTHLARSQTESVVGSSSAVDPRLEEFLQCYKAKGLFKSREQNQGQESSSVSLAARPKAKFSIDGTLDAHDETKPLKLDRKGRPIPPHPDTPKLPPALRRLKQSGHDGDSLHKSSSDSSNSTTASKFGAFLKRVTSHTDESSNRSSSSANSSLADLEQETRSSSSSKSDSTFNPERAANLKEALVIPGLETLKPLKKVSFATNTYFNDPPQQICSRNPRKGEVEVKSDGSVVIHRLTPEEKREILEKSSCGIVVGGSGHLKLLANPNDDEADAKKYEEKAPKPKSVAADGVDGQRHEGDDYDAQNRRKIGLAAAEAAAEARAKEAPNELKRISTNNEEEVGVNSAATKVTIDKPMVSRHPGSSSVSLASMMSSIADDSRPDDEEVFPPPDLRIPHDVVYTRCCHLREILPIPATLKQLKKGSVDPIPLLQLRNPMPSMVEVLSFSDFLSVAPVLCLSLDGVSLSVEMLRVILGSLLYKDNFEKLSLRNTPLDAEGWKVLCYFIFKCKSLNALDLTMVQSIPTNVQKPSKSSLKSKVVRMQCDMESRGDMNWNLLTASVVSSEGLEEMILSGAKMPLEEFKNFIEVACATTQRLGLAYNELSLEHCSVLANWMVHSRVTGLDIGYNDLRGKIAPFASAVVRKVRKTKNVFKFISLNSTNLQVCEGATSENNEVLSLFNALCYCENLKFLDISNNPRIFPHGLNSLTESLPVYVSLVRLHMDYNDLSSTEVVTLAEVLPMCKKLNYVSLLGNKIDMVSGSALATAIRQSNSIITLDIDYNDVPDKVKENVSLYIMKNMENELNRVKGAKESSKSDYSGRLIGLQEELAELLTENIVNKEDHNRVIKSFLERVASVRSKINAVTDDLFKLRVKGELSTEGKEALIRFCFIDASFEKGLKLLAHRYHERASQLCNKLPPEGLDKETSEGSGINIPSYFTVPVEHNMHRTNSTTTLSSTRFSETGHAALLPFHQPSVQSFDPADDDVEIRENENSSVKEAHKQLKEEGDILRKTRVFFRGLKNSANSHGQELDTKALTRAAANMDSEQIKDFILNNDIDATVAILGDLEDRGVNFNVIFKKHHNHNRGNAKDNQPPLRTSDKSEATASNTVVGLHANLMDSKNNNRSASDSDSSSDSESDESVTDEEEEAIERAYDQVLDNLERVRTYNQ